jgi:hypothetical protein
MIKKIIYALAIISLPIPAAVGAEEETIVGKLLSATVAIYEQRDRTVLNTVVRVNNGSYMLVRCDLKNNDPQPLVDLLEAHTLMQAHIFAGSGTNIEVTVVKGSSLTGFPSYTMKSWKMTIPGWDAYRFNCSQST